MPLADKLADWTDWDVASFALGQTLGLFEEKTFQTETKHLFWTDNPLGNGLHNAPLALVQAHVLERREQPDEQFRWSLALS